MRSARGKISLIWFQLRSRDIRSVRLARGEISLIWLLLRLRVERVVILNV